MKKDKPLHDTEVIGRSTEDVAVPINQSEVLVAAEQLARCETELADLEAHAKAQKDELKAKKTAILSRRADLASVVREKKQVRALEVQLLANWTSGTLSKVRVDNGETVTQRKLTEEERQSRFPLEAMGNQAVSPEADL